MPRKILDKTFGDVEGYDDMVVEKNISVTSHCEHHMAPISWYSSCCLYSKR